MKSVKDLSSATETVIHFNPKIACNKHKQPPMAISNKDCSLLFFSKKLNVSFERTLMLGRLKLNASKSDVTSCIKKYGSPAELNEIDRLGDYAEPLFKILGATSVESMDYSDYERATIIHDMNKWVGKNLHSKFTALVDGGTLEHIFNFPVAIMNCMNMLSVGGHYIGISPANNQMGHGFYQFSPELFYRIFSSENGFAVKKMYITPSEKSGGWYEVADPNQVNSRVMVTNHLPLSLMVIAQKIEEKEVFEISPLQSDYQNTWATSEALKNNTPMKTEGKLKFFYRKYFPKTLKIALRFIYDFFTIRKINSYELGTFNANHFKKIEL
jgi:hypothetical protein